MTSVPFPLFLKLEGRKCLVVGGGAIAEQKLDGLLVSGAKVVVVAPSASERIRELANAGRLQWIARRFTPEDLRETALVIAATGDGEVNEQVYREADAQNILCNAVDEPGRCHFFYPAVVRRGDLQIAISTNGKSPALAQRLKAELENYFDVAYADWLRWLGGVRNLFFRANLAPEKRRRALHQVASRAVYERFRAAKQRRSGEVHHG